MYVFLATNIFWALRVWAATHMHHWNSNLRRWWQNKQITNVVPTQKSGTTWINGLFHGYNDNDKVDEIFHQHWKFDVICDCFWVEKKNPLIWIPCDLWVWLLYFHSHAVETCSISESHPDFSDIFQNRKKNTNISRIHVIFHKFIRRPHGTRHRGRAKRRSALAIAHMDHRWMWNWNRKLASFWNQFCG